MRRVNLYLREEEVDFLKRHNGNISENVRRLIDEWMKKESSSTSLSKDGDKNE